MESWIETTQAWIKENPITSILIGAVILLTLIIGYQSIQIDQMCEQLDCNAYQKRIAESKKPKSEYDQRMAEGIKGFEAETKRRQDEIQVLPTRVAELEKIVAGHVRHR